MRIRFVFCPLIVVMLLTGCFRTTEPKPDPGMTPAPSSQVFSSPDVTSMASVPSSTAAPVSPSPTESAWQTPASLKMNQDQRRLPVIDANHAAFHYISTTELDRSALEGALKRQLTSNHPGRTDFSYTLDWQSGKEFTLAFSDLLPRETVHFSVNHPLGTGSAKLNEDMPHLFDAAFQYRDESTPPEIVLTQFQPFGHQYLPVSMTDQQLVKQAGSGKPFALAYDEESLYFTNLSDGTVETVPLPEKKDYILPKTDDGYQLDRVHGYKKVLLPKLFYEDSIYVVMHHSLVYRINIGTGKSRLVYTSDLPIAGMSSSPDGERIGLMMQDYRLLSEADLLVINQAGKVTGRYPKAAYMSHSDGYISTYPLEWTDNNKVSVTTQFPEQSTHGYNEIDVAAKTTAAVPDPKLNLERVKQLAGQEKEFTPFLSPDQSKLAYVTRSNDGFFLEIWLTDLSGSTTQFAGLGMFLGWISPDTIAWVEYDAGERKYGW
ncbi:MAG: hypothetical protein K0R57_1353 [Paenibacillaceae bacterium]|jgi:hypothetical protein|nr:hypothetical protein [Paenibacillaceae bacterium]